MNGSDGTGAGIVAERLDILFTVRALEGRPCSLHDVVDGINAQAGRPVISVQYLSQLRRGDRRSPSLEKLQFIADWFGVDVGYFIDPGRTGRTAEEPRFLKLMNDPVVRCMVARAQGLRPDDLQLVIKMLDVLRKAEGLLPISGDG